MTMTIVPPRTPCLRCLIDQVPRTGTMPSCDTDGVLSMTTGVIASVQSAEALRLLVGLEPAAASSSSTSGSGSSRPSNSASGRIVRPVEWGLLVPRRYRCVLDHCVVRTQCRANRSTHGTTDSVGRAGDAPEANRPGELQRVFAELPHRWVRARALPHRQSDRPGHTERGGSAQPVRALHRNVTTGRSRIRR